MLTLTLGLTPQPLAQARDDLQVNSSKLMYKNLRFMSELSYSSFIHHQTARRRGSGPIVPGTVGAPLDGDRAFDRGETAAGHDLVEPMREMVVRLR